MEPEVLQAFIEEAESYLPAVRGSILIGLQSGETPGEMQSSLLKINTIKGAALTIGLTELGDAAAKLEKRLGEIAGKKQSLTDENSRSLLDQISQIEALLLKQRLNADDFSIDFDAFVEESFENLQIYAPPAKTETKETPPDFPEKEEVFEIAEDEFEIDEEMLEIFALEAEDLLRNISFNLEILAEQPTSREALLEIRRNAHTFKGSAGIVGLKKPSDLAHRMEDLLDYMAERKITGNQKIFEILQASTDCLSALTSGEDFEQIAKKIKRLYKDYDEILEALAAPKTEIPTPETAAAEAVSPDTAELETANNADSNLKIQTAPAKSVVRVSLEKLDDLVKIVHGLVISRSVFERRLGELDRQIEELHHSTQRLQRSTAKLETDFEADMLNVRIPDSGFRISDSKNNPKFKIQNPKSFDSLEFDRYTDFHQSTRELIETASDTFAINTELDGLRGNLESLFDTQRRLIEEMQDKLLRIRMVEFGSLSARLIRTARVTCEEQNKKIDFYIEGEALEIDTQILDSLIEPLLHLLRNAVAHGIEPPDIRRLLGKTEKGKISVRVASEEMRLVVTVSDDGSGISAPALKGKAARGNFISRERAASMTDAEACELIFMPGLTTAEKLSQTAGRGVGMNIIKTAVERRQGTISVASEPQKGTTFTLRLPMALAVTRALLVKAGEQTFAFPLGLIKQITEISAENLEKATRERNIQFGSRKYALTHLNEILSLPYQMPNGEKARVLLLEISDNPCALLVDDIIKPEEIVIKPLGAPLPKIPELIGAAILGDGQITPVLDLFYLFGQQAQNPKSNVQSPQKIRNHSPQDNSKTQNTKYKIINVLIVDDSLSVRHLTSSIVKNAGFNPIAAKDGIEALEILQSSKDLPGIILTDVEMPRMDGYELLSTVKRNADLQSIPVVMITSRASEKHRQKAFELGVSEYLTKPFDDSILLEKIKVLTKSV